MISVNRTFVYGTFHRYICSQESFFKRKGKKVDALLRRKRFLESDAIFEHLLVIKGLQVFTNIEAFFVVINKCAVILCSM